MPVQPETQRPPACFYRYLLPAAAACLLLALVLAACAQPGNQGSPPLTQRPGAAITATRAPATAPATAPAAATASATPAPTATLTTTPTSTSTPTQTATPTPAVLIGAGDVAYCGENHLGDEATADLLGRLLEQHPQAQVFVAGDAVQGIGTAAEYRSCFGPTWGRYLERIRPAPGNHDYWTDPVNYYNYFGAAAGPPGLGYYSYELGGWHIVALNSNCNDIACGPESRQAQWLSEDLAQSAAHCTLLYWHHPRFSSGLAGSYGSVSTFWRTAHAAGAEIVVSGHDHHYERFDPLDADGSPDPDGIRLFIAGTGGTYLRGFGEIKPHSQVRDNSGHGLLLFKLYPDRYEWAFIPVDPDGFRDSGEGECR